MHRRLGKETELFVIETYLPVIALMLVGGGLLVAGFRLESHPFGAETPARVRYGSIALQATGVAAIMAALFAPGLAAALFSLPVQAFGL